MYKFILFMCFWLFEKTYASFLYILSPPSIFKIKAALNRASEIANPPKLERPFPTKPVFPIMKIY